MYNPNPNQKQLEQCWRRNKSKSEVLNKIKKKNPNLKFCTNQSSWIAGGGLVEGLKAEAGGSWWSRGGGLAEIKRERRERERRTGEVQISELQRRDQVRS